MKKFLAAAVVAAIFTTAVQAASGIFGSYIGINPNGAGNTWYGAQQHGNTITGFNNLNLGTFNTSTQTLTISGFQVETFKNGGSDVFGANLYYRVYRTGSTPPSFITQTAAFISNSPFTDAAGNNVTGGGDQLWGRNAGDINLNALSGISVSSFTEYKLEIYFDASTSDGTAYSSNGGANYIATFTAIPEPSTYALLGLAAAGLAAHSIRRRRR